MVDFSLQHYSWRILGIQRFGQMSNAIVYNSTLKLLRMGETKLYGKRNSAIQIGMTFIINDQNDDILNSLRERKLETKTYTLFY